MIERRPGTSILIGDEVEIHIREIKRRNSVRIGVSAPRFLPVVRSELTPDETKSVAKTGRLDFRVWMIEDDDAHAGIIANTLKNHGVPNVERFAEGRPALERLDEEVVTDAPDLILVDLRLPDMPGTDIIPRIRGHATLGRVPIVVLSSSGEDEFVSLSLELGANAYIQKSIEYSEFRDSIVRITQFWSRTLSVA